jgi:antitoxin component of MazEF toxin-antitoxin module
MKTKLKKMGQHYGIVLPTKALKALNLNLNDTVTMKVSGDSLVISKAESFNPTSLDELFKDYTGTYDYDIVFDDFVGREIE